MRVLFFVFLFLSSFNIFSQNGISITSFGAVGDGITDNSVAIQDAIDSAAILGNTVYVPVGVYLFSTGLTIPAGVSLVGEGQGNDPLQTPSNGSLLKYTGIGVAITVQGSNVILGDFVLLDNNNSGASKGILILADSILVESVTIRNVLLSGIVDGTAFELKAKNAGGIAYCSFYDLRVRHGKIGVAIIEEDETSFVNSNSFYHGTVSGGGFEKAVYVDGGNNNLFYGTIIEPPSSSLGHLYVVKGQVVCDEIRIEGINQNDTVPLIFFSAATKDWQVSMVSGHFSGGLVTNLGDNFINMNSSKYVGEKNENHNLLVNSAFYSNGTSDVPFFWNVSGVGVRVEIEMDDFIEGQNSMKVIVPGGVLSEVTPQNEVNPEVKEHPKYDYLNFNTYLKTEEENLATTVMVGASGLATSNYHTGKGSWELVGLTLNTGSNPPDPTIWIDNRSGTDTAIVYVTSPSFAFGGGVPGRSSSVITGQGGVITGDITYGYTSNYSFISGTNYLIIKKGSFFDVSGSNVRIDRINHSTADQKLRGTVITLLFDAIGNVVTNSAYITLKSSFTTATTNSSLQLISNGDGTWRELSRNN